MCGLFGLMSTHLTKYECKPLNAMSYLTCFRGIDSTGIALAHRVGKNKELQTVVHKGIVTPPEFIHSKLVQDQLEASSGDIYAVAGHSRAATLGSIVPKNAHPFRVDHLVGMHNGTIQGLVSKAEDKTDSQTLYEIMAEKGLQEAVNEAKWGAYALVWMDQERETLNFLRNSQRPLYFMKAPGQVICWMSEKWMLDVVRGYMGWDAKVCEVAELREAMHYEFKFGNIDPTVAEVKPKFKTYSYTPPFDTNVGVEGKPYASMYPKKPTHIHTHLCSHRSSTNPQEYPYGPYEFLKRPEVSASKRRKFLGPVFDMPEETVVHMLDEGCVHCSATPDTKAGTESAPFKVYWLKDDKDVEKSSYFCRDCVIKQKAYANWNIRLSELIHGGLQGVES